MPKTDSNPVADLSPFAVVTVVSRLTETIENLERTVRRVEQERAEEKQAETVAARFTKLHERIINEVAEARLSIEGEIYGVANAIRPGLAMETQYRGFIKNDAKKKGEALGLSGRDLDVYVGAAIADARKQSEKNPPPPLPPGGVVEEIVGYRGGVNILDLLDPPITDLADQETVLDLVALTRRAYWLSQHDNGSKTLNAIAVACEKALRHYHPDAANVLIATETGFHPDTNKPIAKGKSRRGSK